MVTRRLGCGPLGTGPTGRRWQLESVLRAPAVARPPEDAPGLLIFLLVLCVVFGLVIYAIFSGILSEDSDGFGFRPRRLRELSPGCLLSIIVVAGLWFLAWMVVLLLAVRLLRTPLGD